MKTCTYLSNNMRRDLLVSIARRKFESADALALAGSLDVGRVRRSIAAKQDRGACHAFIADQSDFDPRWFTANIGMHHVHHLASGIPYYRLPWVLRDYPELAT